jgi:hypothetical protein
MDHFLKIEFKNVQFGWQNRLHCPLEHEDRALLLVVVEKAVHRLVELRNVEVFDGLDLAGVVILYRFGEIHSFTP